MSTDARTVPPAGNGPWEAEPEAAGDIADIAQASGSESHVESRLIRIRGGRNTRDAHRMASASASAAGTRSGSEARACMFFRIQRENPEIVPASGGSSKTFLCTVRENR